MKTIEVEVRGRLQNEETYKNLIKTLSEKGIHKETKKRVLIDYSTFLPGEGVKGRNRDIRLRVTNGIPELITKVGKWGGSEVRKEFSVKCVPGSFDTLVQTYAVLGYTKGVLCVRNSEVFEFQGIEFAVVEVPGHSYYFEAELTARDTENTDELHTRLRNVCEQLGLTVFNDQEFYAYIEVLNKEANEVFDFATYEEGYFAKRFSL